MTMLFRFLLAVVGGVSFLSAGLGAASAATSPSSPDSALHKSSTEKAALGSTIIIARPLGVRAVGSRRPMFWA